MKKILMIALLAVTMLSTTVVAEGRDIGFVRNGACITITDLNSEAWKQMDDLMRSGVKYEDICYIITTDENGDHRVHFEEIEY
jgi:hypothetical protein